MPEWVWIVIAVGVTVLLVASHTFVFARGVIVGADVRDRKETGRMATAADRAEAGEEVPFRARKA